MPFKYEINGQVVEFDREPSESDIDEAASHFKSTPSMKTMGVGGYAKEHPFKTFFEPAAKTITGSSLLERSQKAPLPFPSTNVASNFAQGFGRDLAAFGADVATSPASLAGGVIGSMKPVQQAGRIIAGTKVGQAVGRTLTTPVNSLIQKAWNNLKGSSGAIKENVTNLVKPENLAKEARSAMFKTRSDLGKNLDESIKSLSQTSKETIDLSPQFHDLKNIMASEEGVGLRSEIMRTVRKIKDPETSKILIRAIKNPDSVSNLTLQQSELIKRAISNSSSIGAKGKQGKFANWTPGDIELLDLVDNIKLAQAEKFDALSEIRKPYADYMQAYNVVKNKFKPGQLIKNMKTKFGDPEVNILAEKILPPEVVKKITGYRRTGKVLKYGVPTGLTAVGAGEILRRAFSSR